MSAPVEVINFGCRLNAFEAELMKKRAAEAGLEGVTVVHSCAVTAEAERQVRQAIRKVGRETPERRVVVTGCSSQIDPERYSAMAEVDEVLANDRKLAPASWRALAGDGALDDGRAEDSATPLAGFSDRTRGIVQAQNGCDHRCTFCIIPYGRGPSRSTPPRDVLAQCRALLDAGHLELSLTGVDLTSYGEDLAEEWSLGKLAKAILAELSDLRRLRISSIDPAEVDLDLLDLLANDPRLASHFHLSVQAGDDLILKRMKRRHLRADVIELTQRFRAVRPETTFGCDLIAGFPTEDEAMHRRSLELIEEADLAFAHVFPYSERPGTPAARMPATDKATRKRRAAALRAAASTALGRLMSAAIGEPASVLVEKGGSGRSSRNLLYQAPEGAAPGQWLELRGVTIEDGRLIGEVAR